MGTKNLMKMIYSVMGAGLFLANHFSRNDIAIFIVMIFGMLVLIFFILSLFKKEIFASSSSDYSNVDFLENRNVDHLTGGRAMFVSIGMISIVTIPLLFMFFFNDFIFNNIYISNFVSFLIALPLGYYQFKLNRGFSLKNNQ